MFKHFRDTWDTLRALWAMVRDFFVRYFLPLHSDDDPEEDDDGGGGFFRLDWGDDSEKDGPRALPAPRPVAEEESGDVPGEEPRPSYPGSGGGDPPQAGEAGDDQSEPSSEVPGPK